jgi:acid phosphatase
VRVISGLLIVLALLSGCSSGGPTRDSDSTGPEIRGVPAGLPRPAHVVVVIFENHAADQVIDSPAAPYLTSLARAGAYFVHAHGIAHPSQPNYLALFSGSAHGVFSDACPQNFGRAPNLASQLDRNGYSFVGYAEGLPTPGYLGCRTGEYARKHAPWADFTGLPRTTAQPLAAFPKRLANLPTVSFVVPNLCHDMHDCPVADGDNWARAYLPRYLSWARTHNSLLITTFDEDDHTPANHIATILDGPMVQPGRYPQLIDHYNVLRTLEDMYHLSPLALARRAHPVMCWRTRG